MTEGSGPAVGWADEFARLIANLGFTLDHSATDLPRGGADLHVAIRDRPTLRHFDPEVIAYWVERDGRGRHAYFDRDSILPRDEPFEWGDVRIADRLGETNRFVVFGGDVLAADIDDGLIAVRFRSEAPILRAGGHSQGVDVLAPEAGAFFGRIMIPVDFRVGAEGRLATIDPAALYAGFIADFAHRLGKGRPDVAIPGAGLMQREAARLQADHAAAWSSGLELLRSLGLRE